MRISDWSSDVCSSDLVEVSRLASATTVNEPERTNEAGKKTADIAGRRRFPAGSWVVRMDQPYSRIADTLLDRQYWSPKDKYDTTYDDTGWSMGELFDVPVERVTDATILDASLERVEGDRKSTRLNSSH